MQYQFFLVAIAATMLGCTDEGREPSEQLAVHVVTPTMHIPDSNLQEALRILAHGSDQEVKPLIFGCDSLSESQLALPLDLLRSLRAPNRGSDISILDSCCNGPFTLFVLRLPWRDGEEGRAPGYHPLLVALENDTSKIAGFVLPWNEIIPVFTEEQLNSARELTVWWAMWLKKLEES